MDSFKNYGHHMTAPAIISLGTCQPRKQTVEMNMSSSRSFLNEHCLPLHFCPAYVQK